MAKYDSNAQKLIKEDLHEFKEGKLKARAGYTVENPKQAIAIALSEARKAGDKVPAKPKKTK